MVYGTKTSKTSSFNEIIVFFLKYVESTVARKTL